jgi:hypothetical protein
MGVAWRPDAATPRKNRESSHWPPACFSVRILLRLFLAKNLCVRPPTLMYFLTTYNISNDFDIVF